MAFDLSTAKPVAAAPQGGGFDLSTAKPVYAQEQQAAEQQGGNSLTDVPLEFMAAVNRGATDIADFALGAVPNAVAYAAGSDWRMPKLTDAASAATAGNFMEDGLAKDVVRKGGEIIPAAVTGGGLMRSAAAELPVMASGAEGIAPGILRQVGNTTAAADVGYGAASGVGSALAGEAGEAIGGQTGRQIGEFLGALGLPVLAGSMVSRFTAAPKTAATIADESGLTKAGARQVAEGKVTREAADQAIESVEQQARRKAFEEMGIKPTRAQVTRTADDFMQQQELGKHSGAIRNALEEQDAQLAQRVGEVGKATGGRTVAPSETGYAVEDAITKRVLAEDDAISGLYRQADQAAASTGSQVNLNKFEQVLRGEAPKDSAINNVLKSIVGTLRAQGIIAPKGLKVQARLTPEQAERMVRQEINAHFDATNPLGKQVLRKLKDALDDDVFQSGGQDFYKQARQAVTKSRGAMEAVKKHKFYKNDRSVVRQVLEGRIAPEDIFGRMVVGKGGKVDDIRLMKSYLNSGEGEIGATGKAAWDDLRGQTVQHLLERATKAVATNQRGERVFNGAEFKKAIDQIGAPKLRELLSPEEFGALVKIARVGELRIPVNGTALGQGPSGAAINMLREQLGILGRIGLSMAEKGMQTKAVKGALNGDVVAPPLRSGYQPKQLGVAPIVGAAERVN